MKEHIDADILHLENELNKLFMETNQAIHKNDTASLRKVVHETMQMEIHLHRVDAMIQQEMTKRKGDVAHYYLDRKLHEIRVMFTQAADIVFKIGEHMRHHGHHLSK